MSYGQPSSGNHLLSIEALRKTESLAFWLKIFGGFQLVFGILYCLTIIGAIVGWMPVLLGWTMYQAGVRLQSFAQSNQVSDLEEGLGQLRTHYMTMGIVTIVGVVLWLISFVVYLAIFGLVGFAALAGSAQ